MLSVILPTIAGREQTYRKIRDQYRRSLKGTDFEIITVRDFPSWPAACNEGYRRAKGDVVFFTADDLSPVAGWHTAALQHLAQHDELPAALVWNHTLDGDPDNVHDGKNGDLTYFTRVPIMRRDQYERIGPWPEDLHYYADVWVSERAREQLGILTRLVEGYRFVHHWSTINRVTSDKEQSAARLWRQMQKEMGIKA